MSKKHGALLDVWEHNEGEWEEIAYCLLPDFDLEQINFWLMYAVDLSGTFLCGAIEQ